MATQKSKFRQGFERFVVEAPDTFRLFTRQDLDMPACAGAVAQASSIA